MAPHTDTAALLERVAKHHGEMLEDLAHYVELETPSDDRRLLEAGLARIDAWLRERLGEPAAVSTTGGGAYGDVRVYDYPGEGTAPVLVLAHYDTVWPKGTLADWPFGVDGDRATGPGIFDMKAGLVQAVWALRVLAEAGLSRPPVRLVLNGDEEIGSPVSRPVIEAAAEGAGAALVFEASAAGALKTARKGVGIFRVDVTGVEAHAGLDPRRGVSAVDELARIVLTLHGLTDHEAGTTVNVGVVTGGTRTNVTAGSAVGHLDVRVRTQAEADRIDAALAAVAPADPGRPSPSAASGAGLSWSAPRARQSCSRWPVAWRRTSVWISRSVRSAGPATAISSPRSVCRCSTASAPWATGRTHGASTSASGG